MGRSSETVKETAGEAAGEVIGRTKFRESEIMSGV